MIENRSPLIKWVGWLLVAATFALMMQLNTGSMTLRTGEAPKGGMSLQQTGDVDVVRGILGSWEQRKLLDFARGHIQLDSRFFVPAYVLLLVFAAWRLRRQLARAEHPRAWWLALVVFVGMPVAGILDWTENAGMLSEIRLFEAGTPLPDSLTMRVFVCSSIKYGLIVVSLLIIAFLDVIHVSSMPRRSTS